MASLISGTEVSRCVFLFFLQGFQFHCIICFRDIQAKLKQDVVELQNNLQNFRPGLRIVQVGGREDSNVYIRMKIKAATEIGIDAQHVKFPRTITETELLMGVSALITYITYYLHKLLFNYFLKRPNS